jgi:hypothetical protein
MSGIGLIVATIKSLITGIKFVWNLGEVMASVMARGNEVLGSCAGGVCAPIEVK